MSNTPEYDPTQFEAFAFVIDGEVAVTHAFHKISMPGHCAALSSDPQVVLIPEELKDQIHPGWYYVNGQFTTEAPQ
jgi:hypothetical protein